WPHDDRLLELLAAGMGDHGELGTETFDVLRLSVEVRLGDEEREVGVLGAGDLDAPVDLRLHELPQRGRVRPDHHRAPHRAVVGELRLGDDVLVPTREVVGLGSEHGRLRHGSARYRWTRAAYAPARLRMSSTLASLALASTPLSSSSAMRSASASAAAPTSA